MKFDPKNPFPSVDPESISYEEVKAHAREFDAWLGLSLESVEAKVREALATRARDEALAVSEAISDTSEMSITREFWLSKPVDTFMTPYWDLDYMLRAAGLAASDLVVDLGAGYARLAFVLALRHPDVGFVGIEKIEARILEASRVFATNPLFRAAPRDQYQFLAEDLRETDLAKMSDPLSENTIAVRERTHFLIYDFGSREDIQAVLLKLQALACDQKVIVLARGGRSREIIDREHPWLSQVQPPQHFARFSIYRS